MAIRQPILVRPLAFTIHATGNERANRPASHLAHPKYPGLIWQTNGTSNAWVRGQFASAQSIDFVALLSTNAISGSPGTRLRVRLGTSQAEVDGGAAPYDSAAQVIRSPAITVESGKYHSHLELPSAVSASWFRIDISDHSGDFQAETIVFGSKVSPTRFYEPGFEFGIDDLGSVEFSPQGVVTEEIGIIQRTLGFRFGWLTQAEYEGAMRPIVENIGKRGLIYCCFDPEATTNRQNRTYFGWLRQMPTIAQIRKPETFTVEFAIRSMI